MAAAPAKVVAQYLVDVGIGTWPGGDGPWFVYYGREPNQPDVDPEPVVTVYDDTHLNETMLRQGQPVTHPGINVRIRGVDMDGQGDAYDAGYAKGEEVVRALNAVDCRPVVLDADLTAYRLLSYTLGQNLAWLKEEDPEKRRQIFTINGGRITLWVGR